MKQNNYMLRYLPIFEKDLKEVTFYISNVLNNPVATEKLINNIESAILERSKSSLSFEPYISSRKREYPYYRIYVNNYVIYYVVIDNVMEVRRLLYKARDLNKILWFENS